MEKLLPTFVNGVAVFAGAGIGLLFHGRISQRFRTILFQTIGLVVLLIGLRDAMTSREIPLLALSMILGALLGETINIERRLEGVGEKLQRRLPLKGDSEFIQGFVSASLLFCVGGFTIVGTLRAGVEGNGELLYTKSLLDGHAAIFLASAMGIGVMASGATILFVQGALTILFMYIGGVMTEPMITETGAAGGLMVAAIGINMLELTTIRVGNLLPGMLFAAVFMWVKEIL